MTAGEDYIANIAFLAGCEHGYREGFKARQVVEMAEDEVRLRKEVFQLKARLADAEKALQRVIKFCPTNDGGTNPDGSCLIYEHHVAREYFQKRGVL